VSLRFRVLPRRMTSMTCIVSLRFRVPPRRMTSMTCNVSLRFRVLPRLLQMRIPTSMWIANSGLLQQTWALGPQWARVDYAFSDIWARSGGSERAHIPDWAQLPRSSIFVPTSMVQQKKFFFAYSLLLPMSLTNDWWSETGERTC
jgi:hypothetical protein